MTAPIRVLVVDDSAIVRQAFRNGLNARHGIEVVGVARDPYDARDQIAKLNPDVITLDIEMPRMNGLSFLKRLMKYHPIPTIIVSSVAPRGCDIAIECLEAGAFDIVSKPGQQIQVSEVVDQLAELIRSAGQGDVKVIPKTAAPAPAPRAPELQSAIPKNARKVIAIGASTGGTEALTRVLTPLPADAPGIMVTQHMPPGFTTSFAQRLDSLCQLNVREARNGDRVQQGTVLIADGAFHLKLVRDGQGYVARVMDGPKVCRHKPSVEVMFESVAQVAKSDALGIMLTGMGKDGAGGMLSMRNAGAVTIAQDEASSVVFGMPKEAIEIGAAGLVSPLDDIAGQIVDWACGRLEANRAA